MGRFLRADPHSWKNPTKSGGFFKAILPHELNNPDKIGKLPYGHPHKHAGPQTFDGCLLRPVICSRIYMSVTNTEKPQVFSFSFMWSTDSASLICN